MKRSTRGSLALVALQVPVTALPLALPPFLRLAVERMSTRPGAWPAARAVAIRTSRAVTTLASTPVWTSLATRRVAGRPTEGNDRI
ncbi:hypothetical protein PMNALOAF_1921 [Methylobacterium adhaesivum]|uniref:Secreted protein n=1 Tax=Methylobacterium adhaesivum TaxID=333297 RepID=A0ABT8BC79_9HYPH|nr:hypothetical protein [Methylobacterium adhaesivum]MDN3589654.1 hypothetical protein [Methylobacterium adhaesivum]GJD30671.1 hypothetical protein PMNALOAF_1921 [Methylobacterium adhaesivum]